MTTLSDTKLSTEDINAEIKSLFDEQASTLDAVDTARAAWRNKQATLAEYKAFRTNSYAENDRASARIAELQALRAGEPAQPEVVQEPADSDDLFDFSL